jgi:hypothetical protein
MTNEILRLLLEFEQNIVKPSIENNNIYITIQLYIKPKCHY